MDLSSPEYLITYSIIQRGQATEIELLCSNHLGSGSNPYSLGSGLNPLSLGSRSNPYSSGSRLNQGSSGYKGSALTNQLHLVPQMQDTDMIIDRHFFRTLFTAGIDDRTEPHYEVSQSQNETQFKSPSYYASQEVRTTPSHRRRIMQCLQTEKYSI